MLVSLSRCLRLLPLALGFLLLGYLVQRLEFDSIHGYVGTIGYWAFPILLVSAVWKCSNTGAWVLAFPSGEPRPGFWRLFRVNLAGDVINNVIPTGNLGGEAAKPYLLGEEVSRSRAVSSVVANKTMEVCRGRELRRPVGALHGRRLRRPGAVFLLRGR